MEATCLVKTFTNVLTALYFMSAAVRQPSMPHTCKLLKQEHCQQIICWLTPYFTNLMTFCIGSSNISASFLHTICRGMTQCNNASGVFSFSYAQGLWKPACALWSFHIAPLAWKNQTPGQILYQQHPCTFKPNETKLSHHLFWILKIMYWVYVARFW